MSIDQNHREFHCIKAKCGVFILSKRRFSEILKQESLHSLLESIVHPATQLYVPVETGRRQGSHPELLPAQ